jgi:uncharacterized membrane protein YGL010W
VAIFYIVLDLTNELVHIVVVLMPFWLVSRIM